MQIKIEIESSKQYSCFLENEIICGFSDWKEFIYSCIEDAKKLSDYKKIFYYFQNRKHKYLLVMKKSNILFIYLTNKIAPDISEIKEEDLKKKEKEFLLNFQAREFKKMIKLL